MKIRFIKSGYNSYGGGLEEPFKYLGMIISDRFELEKLNNSFNNLEIEIAKFSNKPKGEQKEIYNQWFNKLPNYYRGKNLIRVILPVFKEEKSLEDVFKLIYNAFEIIGLKKKKEDVFNAEKIKNVLTLLETELKTSDLWKLNKQYKSTLRKEAISKRLVERIERENRNIENKRLIYDLRFYYHFENIKKFYFAPYGNQLCKIILIKLRERKFKLPDYTHIYINVSNSFENALYEAVREETWFAYGIAVLEDYIGYEKKSEKDKKAIVFSLIKQGLIDIAKIDKLDTDTLNEVLNEVENEIK